jgi:pSer/pThr/pTyr-binding forkhead associated (FHA) protein
MVFYDGRTVGVLDLVSKNGTFVNGQEVESRVLKPGDMIEIGETNIVYEG